MKKTVMTAGMVLALASAVFADGWKVGGYIRAGIEGNSESESVETKTYNDGKYYGNGKSRLRLNLDYSKDNYGANIRFQNDKFGFNADDWFKEGNIKYAMGYAKFLDGKIVAEAGKLKDSYTSSEGYEGFNLSDYYGTYGARAVFSPVENLWISAQASTLRAEKYTDTDDKVKDGKAKAGDLILNEKIASVSAKYKTDNFTVAGGYNLGGEAYAFFGLKAVKNLKANFEADWLSKDVSGKKDGDGKDTDYTTLVEDVNYNFKDDFAPLEFGVLAYQKIVSDNSAYEFYPHAAFAFNDIVTAGIESGIKMYEDKDTDTTYSVTPSLTFNAGKATAKVYYTYDKDSKSSFGTSVKVNF